VRQSENLRIMQENMAVIEQINAIRSKLSQKQQANQAPKRKLMEKSKKDRDAEEEEAKKTLHLQQQKIANLRSQIDDARTIIVKPLSSERTRATSVNNSH